MPLFSLGSHPRHLCGLKQCSVSVQQAKSLHFNMSHLSEGELTSAVISSFPARRDPEEQEKEERKRCRYFWNCHFMHTCMHTYAVWMCCMPSECPLPRTASSSLISDELRRCRDRSLAVCLIFFLFFFYRWHPSDKRNGSSHVNTLQESA